MSSLGNITIPWNDFDSHLRSSIKNLRKDSSFCDVSLICEDVEVKAHKVILASSSLTFSRILHRNPNPHPLIYLINVKMKDMIHLLNYMYSGQIEVASEDTAPILEIFKEFQVKGFYPDASISDNSLASRTDQRDQSVPMVWINQDVLDISIKTEDDHDAAESAATQSHINKSIRTSTEDNAGSTGSESPDNNCSIQTDTSRSSAMPSTINQASLPVGEDGELVKGGSLNSAQHLRPPSLSLQRENVRLSSESSCAENSRKQDASSTTNLPGPTSPIFKKKNKSVKLLEGTQKSSPAATQPHANQSVLTCIEDNAGSTGSESPENDCSIRTDASEPSATPSTITQASLPVREDGELVKGGSLNSARHLRSSLSLQPENVRLSSEPSRAEKSRKQDVSSTTNLSGPSSSISKKGNESVKKSKGTQKASPLNLTSSIINAIKKIKSKKKAPNVKRITAAVIRFLPNMKNISLRDVLEQLNKAVERGVVQRIHKREVTYKIT